MLHAWGRQLPYHPHLHYVMAGGGPSADGEHWLPHARTSSCPPSRSRYSIRGKFRDAMKHAGLLTDIDPAAWKKDWVVDIQAVGDGRTAIRYLAPYIFRVAISDRRIRASDDDHVTFTWRKSGSRRHRSMRLEAHEFLRRFLQHVLLRGFQNVRYYGFLSTSGGNSFERARWLATLHARETFTLEPAASRTPPVPPRQRCADCGGDIRVVRFLRVRGTATFNSS